MMNSEPAAAYRYAVYAVPERASALWQAGRQWLGRCAETGEAFPLNGPDTATSDWWVAAVKEPRRYGWHATLKAPFRLRPGVALDDLKASLHALSQQWGALPPLPLRVTRLGHFLALCAPDPRAGQAMAQACVVELDALAAPLAPQELARRQDKAQLSPREDQLLRRWGYPYVMERYRLHYSLTGSLDHLPDPTRQALWQAARERFDGLPPQSLGSIALFAEPAPGADFQLLERF